MGNFNRKTYWLGTRDCQLRAKRIHQNRSQYVACAWGYPCKFIYALSEAIVIIQISIRVILKMWWGLATVVPAILSECFLVTVTSHTAFLISLDSSSHWTWEGRGMNPLFLLTSLQSPLLAKAGTKFTCKGDGSSSSSYHKPGERCLIWSWKSNTFRPSTYSRNALKDLSCQRFQLLKKKGIQKKWFQLKPIYNFSLFRKHIKMAVKELFRV